MTWRFGQIKVILTLGIVVKGDERPVSDDSCNSNASRVSCVFQRTADEVFHGCGVEELLGVASATRLQQMGSMQRGAKTSPMGKG